MPNEASVSVCGCQPIPKQPSHFHPPNLSLFPSSLQFYSSLSLFIFSRKKIIYISVLSSLSPPLSLLSFCLSFPFSCRPWQRTAPSFLMAPDCISTWSHSFLSVPLSNCSSWYHQQLHERVFAVCKIIMTSLLKPFQNFGPMFGRRDKSHLLPPWKSEGKTSVFCAANLRMWYLHKPPKLHLWV